METKVKRLYDIDIFKLNNGEHQYSFEINDAFFTLFNYGLIEKGEGKVEVELVKSDTMITMDFDIRVNVELICDRSLEAFSYPLELDERLLVKYGEEEEELDDDLLVITQNTQKINVAQFIYEIIGISLPMKKIHPDYLEEDDVEDEDNMSEVKLVYSSLDKTEENEENGEEIDEERPVDPRWDILKNLKNN